MSQAVQVQGLNAAGGVAVLTLSGDGKLLLGSAAYRAQLPIPRPANVTPYASGDVVGGVLTFPVMGPTAGHISLTSLDMRVDVAAIPAGMSSFRLHFYKTTPPSALADNSPWTLTGTDRDAYISYVDLSLPQVLAGTLFTQVDGVFKQLQLGAGETALYGYLVTTGGYTPAAASEVYTVCLRAEGV